MQVKPNKQLDYVVTSSMQTPYILTYSKTITNEMHATASRRFYSVYDDNNQLVLHTSNKSLALHTLNSVLASSSEATSV